MNSQPNESPPRRVVHCCGWTYRYRRRNAFGAVVIRSRGGSDVEVICRKCKKPMTREISGATLAAFQLGGWEAITSEDDNWRFYARLQKNNE